MALEIRVLGRVDAIIDGQALPLGGSKQRAVLAMLALRANRTVSADELIDGLWADRLPASAGKNLQLYISRLRKALAGNGSGAEIVTRGRGYELQVPNNAVDAMRFEALVERARADAEQGIVDGAAQSALELWRGAPLADVADEPFAASAIRSLEELRLRAIELTIDAKLAAGRHGDLTASLEALIAEHPFHERFHARLMLALYRAGRQSDALDAYRHARRMLIDELGIEPGPDLSRLEQQILRQDPALDPPLPRTELPPQLEAASPLLAGRKRELHWLLSRWRDAASGDARIALLSGPAGIGKTRLAAELAAELQRGGAAILYAGSAAPDAAREVVRVAAESERPTLLVLDDADDASPDVLEAAAGLGTRPRDTPILVVVLHRDDQVPPAFAAAERRGEAVRLALGPLAAEALAEIAGLYAPAEGLAMPIEMLTTASDGVPLRAHRAASEWSQGQAAQRLEATVGTAEVERGGLRAAEADVAGRVADLQTARERARLYAGDQPVDPSKGDICPFRGLAPFDAAHAEFFFGRERLVAGLVARLVGSTLLAVVGPSGSGKSSLVRAGLLPALANGVLPGSEGWRQLVMRPGDRPLAELRRALARLGMNDGDPLAALVGGTSDDRVILVVDQLEETFTACGDEHERAAFADALAALADDPDQHVVVVLAIRADFYGRCAGYRLLSAYMSANNVLVGPMRREELRRAIELPAQRAGLRVEPRLVSALIGDVAEEPGGLPLLSTALVELWEERSGRTLGYTSYERSGGVDGAVARLAERAYQRLSPNERRRARAMLLRLTDADQAVPVRRRVQLAELDAETDDETARVLAVLTENRLVTVDEGTAEVAHEALLREWPRLRAWLEEDIEGRRLHQHLTHAAGEWADAGRDPAELYRGTRLGSALDWAAGHDHELNELEREFLAASKVASEQEAERQLRTNRRLRALLAGAGVLLAAAVVAGVVAISEQRRARNAARAETAQRLAAEAVNERRLDQALLRATAGVALDDSVATRSSLFSVLMRSPETLGVMAGQGDELWALAVSPDGRTLAVGDTAGRVFLFDAETRKRVGEYQASGGAVTSLAFHPGGEHLAIAGRDPPNGWTGHLHVIDVQRQELRKSIALGRHPADRSRERTCSPAAQDCSPYYPTANWAPDGRMLVVGYPGDPGAGIPMFLRRFDALSGTPVGRAVQVARGSSGVSGVHSLPAWRLLYADDDVTYVIDGRTLRVRRRYPAGGYTAAVSADGKRLALGSDSGAIRMLDLPSGEVERLRRPHREAVNSMVFSADGRRLASTGDDGSLFVRSLRGRRAVESLAGHDAPISSQGFSPDGDTLYTASADTTARAWDVAGDRRLARAFRTGISEIPEEGFPPAFAVSPNGRTLAAARFDGSVELVDVETLRRTGTFKAFDRTPATAIDYAPDGQRLAVAGGRGLVGVWDVRSRQRVGPLLEAPRRGACADPGSMFQIPRCHDRTIQQALVFGPAGVLTASIGGDVRHWDLTGRERTRPSPRVQPYTLGLDLSPDGSKVAVTYGFGNAGADGVEIRDVETGKRVARLRTDREVRAVAFSPDGGLLATGHVDGKVRLWTTDAWRDTGAPLAPGRGFVLWVEFAPDGRTLATSSDTGRVELFDVASREPIGPPLSGVEDQWVTGRFTPDGDHLLALYTNGRAMRWTVDPASWARQACAITGGGLTREQWDAVVPEEDYRQVCPSG